MTPPTVTEPRTQPTFSVILATRNRAESLRETLDALARQETAGAFTYEVVVVDNGSSDHTRGVVEALHHCFPVLLRYVYEGRLGKPWAFNAGIEQARGRFFACTDDDVLPTSTWLAALWRCLLEEQANGVAGRILPLWLAPRPAWLTDALAKRFSDVLGCVDYGPNRRRMLNQHHGSWVGGNLAIRREIVQRVGAYDTRMIRAQDTEYYVRCIEHGAKVVYEPSALAYHKIGADRMIPDYFRHWHHVTGYYRAYLLPWSPLHLLTVMPIEWYRKTWEFAVGWTKNFLLHGPWTERFRCELWLRWTFSFWLHRLQLWPRWWWTVITGRWYLPSGKSRGR